MPKINLPSKKEKKNIKNNTDHRKIRQIAYNNSEWRKLRDVYIKEHAVCADCLAKGIITPSQDVHHIKSPFINGSINYTLLNDYTNLTALCKECHAARHNKEQGHITPEEIIKQLDELFGE